MSLWWNQISDDQVDSKMKNPQGTVQSASLSRASWAFLLGKEIQQDVNMFAEGHGVEWLYAKIENFLTDSH